MSNADILGVAMFVFFDLKYFKFKKAYIKLYFLFYKHVTQYACAINFLLKINAIVYIKII